MRLTATQVARKRHERSGLAREVVMFRCQIATGSICGGVESVGSASSDVRMSSIGRPTASRFAEHPVGEPPGQPKLVSRQS